MKERLDNLLTVKSIVTILLTLTFVILSVRGTITGDQFLSVFITVIAFYYGTQHGKNNKDTTATTTAANKEV